MATLKAEPFPLSAPLAAIRSSRSSTSGDRGWLRCFIIDGSGQAYFKLFKITLGDCPKEYSPFLSLENSLM